MNALQYKDLPYYTYKDYILWEGKWELIQGVPYAMAPAPGMYHQSLNGKIFSTMQSAMKSCGKCEVFLPIDWKIAEDTIVQPDILVVCLPFEMGTFLTKTPQIIFEILSPSTVVKDRGLKYSIYEREGVKYYIIVNPIKKIAEVYVLEDGKYILAGEFDTATFTFETDDCSFALDFSKVW